MLLRDFTGVPCIVNLAAMREAMAALGGDPSRISPLRPAELIIDHSVIADYFGRPDALERNIGLEYQRNAECYQFLRWGQQALRGLRVVPPAPGSARPGTRKALGGGDLAVPPHGGPRPGRPAHSPGRARPGLGTTASFNTSSIV